MQERILLEPMFEAPGSDIVDVIITPEVVKDNAPPQYVYRPKDAPSDPEEDSSFEELPREVSVHNS